MGKTTLAAKMDGALILAFERGYNALPGVIAQDITTWSEMRQVYRELKKPEVKQHFKAVIVDTIDIAADMCQKYICNQNSIESLGELGYGKGWTAFKNEFNEIFRGLTQLGYAVFFIGHHKEVVTTDANGVNKTSIRPALSASIRMVIEGMADIYGYAHQKQGESMSVLTLRSDDSIACGGRFKYMPTEIVMNYDNLVNALNAAIDKEAAEHGNEFVTDEKIKPVDRPELDFDAMNIQFQNIVGEIIQKDQGNHVKITQIVEKYLGQGKKFANCTPQQCEQMELILQDLAELLK